MEMTPHVYLRGRASAGYRAKRIISLIVAVADMVNADPAMHTEKLKVVFIEDFRVSLAEIIIRRRISPSRSPLRSEASGTGNMEN